MKILEQVLSKINFINKKEATFFLILIQGLIGIAGKRTFRNLARYMQLASIHFRDNSTAKGERATKKI